MSEIGDNSGKTPVDSAIGESPFNALELMKDLRANTVNIASWKTVAFVIPDKEYGSGFFVDVGRPDKCVVATDDHVVHTFPKVTLDDGNSYRAHRIKTNVDNEMAYLELQDVPYPERQCKPAKLASNDHYDSNSDVMIIDKRTDKAKPLTGKMESSEIRSTKFSNGFFSTPTSLSTVRHLLPGAGPGTSGTPVYDRNGEIKSVIAGGFGEHALAKPIGSIREDIADLKARYANDKAVD